MGYTDPKTGKEVNLSVSQMKEKAKKLRAEAVMAIFRAQSGHPGGSLSAADIVTALYYNVMKTNSRNHNWEQRDRFVMSKGHCVPIQYAALADLGFFPKQWMEKLRQVNSPLQGHPDMNKTPGIEVNTGSLGQGLGIALGMALGLSLDKSKSRVYCIVGDGECQEGNIWESAMSASHFAADNLCAILDKNCLQIDGKCEDVMAVEPLDKKFTAFGWHVIKIDGHDFKQILDAFKEAEKTKGKPTIIIANTIKGKGVSCMENKVGFHGKAPDNEQLDSAMKELGYCEV